MKPNYSAVAAVSTTMQGEDVVMGFDEGAMTHLMGILSEIYTRPTLAVAREYITNAIDSHIEAGQDRPVEVTTPNVWESNLTIQDFGIGMDIDDIRNTYSKYGASTKRDSDSFNGMLGIGSKSAFAYSNAFTVTGIKNGVKTIVSVSRDDAGRGVMTILGQSNTDEGNGVTIKVPVSNAHEMKMAVEQVASVLPENTLLVNGKDLSQRGEWSLMKQNITDDNGNVVVRNLWRKPGAGRHNSRIIMGNVAYELSADTLNRSNNWLDPQSAIIAEVEMGAVVFAPSREKLMDVPKTRAVEKTVVDAFNNHLAQSILQEIKDAPTPFDALVSWNKHYRTLGSAGVKTASYKGKTIPLVNTNVVTSDDRLVAWTYTINGGRGSMQHTQYLRYSHFVTDHWNRPSTKAHIVINAPDSTPTSTFKAKLRQHFNDGRVVIIPERVKIKDYWLDGGFTEYETIRKVVLPRRASSGTRTYTGVSTKGKHFVAKPNGNYDLRELEDDEKILYVNKADVIQNWNLYYTFKVENNEGGFQDFTVKMHDALPKDTILVHVYANRMEKFVKDYPNATALTATSAHGMMMEKIRKGISDDDIKAWASSMAFSDSSVFESLPDKDKDKQIALMSKGNTAAVNKVDRALRLLSPTDDLRKKIGKVQNDVIQVRDRLYTRYPLLNRHSFLANHISKERLAVYFSADFNINNQEDN